MTVRRTGIGMGMPDGRELVASTDELITQNAQIASTRILALNESVVKLNTAVLEGDPAAQSLVDEVLAAVEVSAGGVIAERLGNVDNTSDADKPVSTATAEALARKSGAAAPTEFVPNPASVGGPVGKRLTVPTHLSPGGGETTHPSVVFIPDGWNGFEYWMAHTPYPGGSDDHEDPNIACSRDGISWVVPGGLTNPIDDQSGQPEYNSDVDLRMGPGNTLYLFWRFYDPNAVGQQEQLFFSTSKDGRTWTPKTMFYRSAESTLRLVSPSFVLEDGHWTMWAVDIATSPNRMVRLQSATEDPQSAWSAPVVCNTGPMQAGKEPWHPNVIHFGGRYFCLLNDCLTDLSGADGDILLMVSADGLAWTNSGQTVIPRLQPGEHTKLYRASLIPAAYDGLTGFRVWYAAWQTVNGVHQWNLYRTFIAEYGPKWVQLGLASGWSAYVGGGGYYSGLRLKKAGPTVFIEGTVRSGAAGSVIAVLPPEYIPESTRFVAVNAAGAVGLIQVFGKNADAADLGRVKYFLGAGTPNYLPVSDSWQATL